MWIWKEDNGVLPPGVPKLYKRKEKALKGSRNREDMSNQKDYQEIYKMIKNTLKYIKETCRLDK